MVAADCRGSAQWPDLGLAVRQLAPVANKPVLFHHLESLASAGIRQAAVVTDHTTRAGIRDAVGDGAKWGLEVCYLDGASATNVLASPEVAAFADAEPVVVQHGDVLLRERISALCARFADDGLDALVLQLDHPSVARHTAPTGYVVGSDAQRALAAAGGTVGLDKALARLRVDGARVEVREVVACLPCRGSTDALLEANRQMLEEIVPEHRGERVFNSELQGRVALHPSAEVRDSLIRGPVAIGPRASISNAYIGPYTSIGADVTIESAEVEHSIVLEGAQIRFLGVRLEGSLVGPGARITRAFRVPRALRLSVGGGAEIAMD